MHFTILRLPEFETSIGASEANGPTWCVGAIPLGC